MTEKTDDLDAVRTIAETLAQFEPHEQERIIRWAMERVGLPVGSAPPTQISPRVPPTPAPTPGEGLPPASDGFGAKDIKSFMEKKRPSADTEFAAAVAYYYRFEAPVPERRETIGKDDLLEACRLVGRERPARPAQTLVNAHGAGVLDKAGRGQYSINTVGENLVAITLPTADAASPKPRRKSPLSKKSKSQAEAKKGQGGNKLQDKEIGKKSTSDTGNEN